MLLHALQPTLCQLGFHAWRSAPQDEDVPSCARWEATRVTLRPGRKVSVADVQIEIADEKVYVKESA
jgi:hypothetical protein